MAIISLLIVNAVLLYSKYQQDKIIHDKDDELSQIAEMRLQLEREYYEALSELEIMRGENDQMDLLIDKQQSEITSQRNRINDLITVRNDLKQAQAEMKNLRTKVDGYLGQISTLDTENRRLKDTADLLREERLLLTKKIAEERQYNNELITEQLQILKDKGQLEEMNKLLQSRVRMASVIDVTKLEVRGYNYGENNSERSRKKARNIQLLKICFDTQPNDVVPQGPETFYVRIIDPYGETLAIENLGSGVLESGNDQSYIKYTKSYTLEYGDPQIQSVCIGWAPGIPFVSGEYMVEVYNKGFLAGANLFELK